MITIPPENKTRKESVNADSFLVFLYCRFIWKFFRENHMQTVHTWQRRV